MDRRSAAAFVSAAFAAFAALACAAFVAAQALPSLRATRWLPEDRRLSALSTEPGECLAPAEDAATTRRVAIGRAAFRTPLLLGGQAARNGLSCDACHRNGRDNPDFFIAGLSDAPGTADVTTSLFSSHRGDGVFNPKPIPDLAAAPETHKVARNTNDRALETFVRGLIVEEFDGPEPTPATLDGLAAYIRHLRPSACEASKPANLAADLDRVRTALVATQYTLDDNDSATARLMLASARSSLASIDERYSTARYRNQRIALRAAAQELASLQAAIDRGEPDLDLRIAAWLANMRAWSKPLQQEEGNSLYTASRLAEALDNASRSPPDGH